MYGVITDLFRKECSVCFPDSTVLEVLKDIMLALVTQLPENSNWLIVFRWVSFCTE